MTEGVLSMKKRIKKASNQVIGFFKKKRLSDKELPHHSVKEHDDAEHDLNVKTRGGGQNSQH